jgi:opacity protein-like surface antigen
MKLFKYTAAALIALLSYTANADTTSSSSFTGLSDRWYIGAFGGGGSFTANNITQSGTALLDESSGGPLAVNAQGSGSAGGVAAVGMYVGYKWPGLIPQDKNSAWSVMPSTELEGYYFQGTLDGNNLDNPTPRLDAHNFSVAYPMDNGAFLLNAVFTLNHTESKFHPYLGLGVGTAVVSISGATSTQTAPAEPGVNHYNSDTDASDWTFAAQSKLGLRYNMSENTSIFVEYRFLYLSPTDFTFGSTQYPTHAETTDWNVEISGMYYNMATAGIQFDA